MQTNQNRGKAAETGADSDTGTRQVSPGSGRNRLLTVLVVVQFGVLAALGGWFIGRRPPARSVQEFRSVNCPYALPPRGVALMRGIRCLHGTPVVDAHCDDGHAMKAFVLEMFKQGLDDDEVKSALLRRYGEKALAGREWDVPVSPPADRVKPTVPVPASKPLVPSPKIVPKPTPAQEPDDTTTTLLDQQFPAIELERWVRGSSEFGEPTGARLESFEGKVVLLAFVYPQRGPLEKVLDALGKLHVQYSHQDFAVLSLCPHWGGVGLETWLARSPVRHPVAVVTAATEQAYRLKDFPTYVLLDRHGTVRWVGVKSELPVKEVVRLLAVKEVAAKATAGPLKISQVERLRRSFDPTAGETVSLRFSLSVPAEVALRIHGPNRELIATILDGKACDAGLNTVTWDGRDIEGNVVPDEAYFVWIRATAGADSDLWDPFLASGGERLVAGGLKTRDPNRLSYQLPKASRVLVRAVVEGGPLIRTIVNWEPRPAGLCVESWDGMDADGIRQGDDIDGLRLMVMAFALPVKSIIAMGNSSTDYRTYYLEKRVQGLHLEKTPRVKSVGTLISPYWQIPPHLNCDPQLEMTLPGVDDLPNGAPAVTVVSKSSPTVQLRVDIPDPHERAFMNNEKFELIIYVNDRRIMEVEQAHIPFTYPWDTSNLAVGRHLLTVNVASFRNHVGTVSRRVEIEQ
ncbi:MAG: hypothetical protein KAV82_04625 [Phycisphaerae bacterium]|nr:hypothetical protein [Phycisphaerae bacterium]